MYRVREALNESRHIQCNEGRTETDIDNKEYKESQTTEKWSIDMIDEAKPCLCSEIFVKQRGVENLTKRRMT